jgi:hypothetical protein
MTAITTDLSRLLRGLYGRWEGVLRLRSRTITGEGDGDDRALISVL